MSFICISGKKKLSLPRKVARKSVAVLGKVARKSVVLQIKVARKKVNRLKLNAICIDGK